jgi:hypothetical protein
MLLANPKQLPDPQVNRERPPGRLSREGRTCGSLLFPYAGAGPIGPPGTPRDVAHVASRTS